MSNAEINQLELFAQVDELIRRLNQWSEGDSAWEPLNQSRALVRRLLTRLETLRIRLEAPLVVATFGGTGTGKSSLVNALVGTDCTKAGRERPTTRRPILICQSGTDLQSLNMPLEQFEIQYVASPVLRDVVIVDCPDPDTNEAETPGSNLELLRQLLPHCDVLIYTSTQQKYRNARVIDELDIAATGVRLLFVQTHAGVDQDIREDWREQLSDKFEIPEVFFVDSVQALEQQQQGERPTGDFARLQDLLTTRLASVGRVQIRRANLLDLTEATVKRCGETLGKYEPHLAKLEEIMAEHRQKLAGEMSSQLKTQLEGSRRLWEQRILTQVTSLWGVSPFSSILRLYNGLGALIASATLLRARSGAQMLLIGAVQGTKWLTSKRKDREAESAFEQIASLGIDENLIREARFTIRGSLNDARLDPALADEINADEVRAEAARLEDRFLDRAKKRIDTAIDTLAKRNSGFFARAWYELLFVSFIGYVLFRAGKNFFYDSHFAAETKEVLGVNFYVSAAVFFAIWSTVLVICFCRRLRRGLNTEIATISDELAKDRLTGGLFPSLEETLRDTTIQRSRLAQITIMCDQLRSTVATSPDLGSPRQLNSESVGRLPQ
jgi:hypothetical protein